MSSPSLCLVAASLLLGPLVPIAEAKPKPPKIGFEKIAARFNGGYQIVSPEGTLAGPATVQVRSSAKGRAGKVEWRNTFYTAHGSYRVTLRWKFLPNGTMTANTVDARRTSLPARGSFSVSRARTIPFTAAATNSPVSAVAALETRGGGSLFITVTLNGLPEGVVTCSFSGGRVR